MQRALVGLLLVLCHFSQAARLWEECDVFLQNAGSPGLRKAVIEVERNRRELDLYGDLSQSAETQLAILKRKYGWKIVFLRFGRSWEASNFRVQLKERRNVRRYLAQLQDQQSQVLEAYEIAVSRTLADWAREDASRFVDLRSETSILYRLARAAAEEAESLLTMSWTAMNAVSFTDESWNGMNGFQAGLNYGPVKDRVSAVILRLEIFGRVLRAEPNAADLKPVIVYIAGQREALQGTHGELPNLQRQWDILHGIETVTQAMGGARD